MTTQYETAVKLVRECRKASVSFLQHAMDLPYGMAADFIERMERENIITAPSATGRRTLVKTPKQKYSPEDYLRSG